MPTRLVIVKAKHSVILTAKLMRLEIVKDLRSAMLKVKPKLKETVKEKHSVILTEKLMRLDFEREKLKEKHLGFAMERLMEKWKG
jgi:hypothetical protein